MKDDEGRIQNFQVKLERGMLPYYNLTVAEVIVPKRDISDISGLLWGKYPKDF